MKFPEQFREPTKWSLYNSKAGDPFGAFFIKAKQAKGRALRIIAVAASSGPETEGWDHLSVTLPEFRNQTPTWAEMCFLKSLFWEPNECVVQYHPPEGNYVNIHHGALHLWSRADGFPLPPTKFV